MNAGELRHRVGFYKRIEASDGAGSIEGAFDDVAQITVAANIRPRLGGEQVLAGRLTGVNAVNITVRQSIATRQVKTDWQARDERSLTVYAIRSIVDPDEGNARRGTWLEMLCEQGVAA